MIEDQLGDAVLLDECLQGEGIERVEDEVGVLQIDIECLRLLMAEVVEYERSLAAASGTVEVEIAAGGEGGLSQNKMVVSGWMFMVMFEQIHLKYSYLSFL